MIVNIMLCLFWLASSVSVLALQSKLEGGEYHLVTSAIIVLVSVLIGFTLGRWKDSDE